MYRIEKENQIIGSVLDKDKTGKLVFLSDKEAKITDDGVRKIPMHSVNLPLHTLKCTNHSVSLAPLISNCFLIYIHPTTVG
jgi:hypothetical protein